MKLKILRFWNETWRKEQRVFLGLEFHCRQSNFVKISSFILNKNSRYSQHFFIQIPYFPTCLDNLCFINSTQFINVSFDFGAPKYFFESFYIFMFPINSYCDQLFDKKHVSTSFLLRLCYFFLTKTLLILCKWHEYV